MSNSSLVGHRFFVAKEDSPHEALEPGRLPGTRTTAGFITPDSKILEFYSDAMPLAYAPVKEFNSFKEEKEFRTRWGQPRSSVHLWPQAHLASDIDAGVKEIVRQINLLTYAFTFHWSHSNLPSNHKWTQRELGLPIYGGHAGRHTGVVMFRADDTNPLFQKLKENLEEAGGIITRGALNVEHYRTFKRQPLYQLEVKLENPPKNVSEYEARMKELWAGILSAIKKSRAVKRKLRFK